MRQGRARRAGSSGAVTLALARAIVLLGLALPLQAVVADTATAAAIGADAAQAFADGRVALQAAQREADVARGTLLEAGRLRRSLQAQRGAGTDLAAQLEDLQQRGAVARERADQARREAAAHFARGLTLGWPVWVRDTAPLTMDSELQQALARVPGAHNTRWRSVHPNMPPPAAEVAAREAGAAAAPDEAFTLQFPMLASQNPPRDLDIASFQLSRGDRFVAHIEVDAPDGTPAGAAAVPLNRLHRWRLLLSDLHGAPLRGARIDVAGHMPGHVHGLPTQPRVTAEIAPGVYRVEGLKFQMDGWWVMQFEVHPAAAGGDPQPPDNVAFNLVF